MRDLEEQVRRYADGLDRAAAGTPVVRLARRRRGRRWVLVGAGVAAAALVAVVIESMRQDDRDTVTVTDVPELLDSELRDRTFVVIAMEEAGTLQPLAARVPVLTFDGSSLQVDTSCNGAMADYVLVGGELVLSGFFTTHQLCRGSTGGQEQLLDALLGINDQGGGRPPTAVVHGDLLELRRGDLTVWAVETTDQERVDWPDATDAADATRSFVQIVADEQWSDATYLWKGYGDAHAANLVAARAELEALASLHPWLARGEPQGSVTFAPLRSAGFTPRVVVTAVSEPDGDSPREAAAFVVDPTRSRPVIRIPRPEDVPFDVAPGSNVRPGQRIARPIVPVEGGAVVYVNGVSVPFDVDHQGLTTSFVVPAWARGEIVVTMSSATPEEPDAYAAWYRVG